MLTLLYIAYTAFIYSIWKKEIFVSTANSIFGAVWWLATNERHATHHLPDVKKRTWETHKNNILTQIFHNKSNCMIGMTEFFISLRFRISKKFFFSYCFECYLWKFRVLCRKFSCRLGGVFCFMKNTSIITRKEK